MEKIKNLETALQLFEEAAINHAAATELGDYKTANKAYTVISNVIKYLKKENKMQCLSVFLEHSSAGVRIWAATYLLPVCEKEGIEVLEQIAKGSGILSFDAEMTLAEWRKGNLKL